MSPLAAELKTTFLFEHLTDDQLEWLAERGRVQSYAAGETVYAEGDPAEVYVVLLDGRLRLTKRVQIDDVTLVETDQRGVYGGAVRAYISSAQQTYQNGMIALAPSRFFLLPAADFAELMRRWFPMALHLLDGLYLGIRNAEAVVGSRERLIALGSMSAGLAHELNNPAAAGRRAAGALRARIAAMRNKLAALADGHVDAETLRRLVACQTAATERAEHAPELSPLDRADAEDELVDWLEDHDVSGAGDLAPVFVAAGLDTAWADGVAAATDARHLEGALRWLAYTLDADSLIDELEDAMTRISNLVGAVRQYSNMDRTPYRDTDLHEGLNSTLVMLSAKLGPDIDVVKDYDKTLPPVPAYTGELNQVWTNLIDNAIDAMDGRGTLTVRTGRDGDFAMVEIVDTGIGIPTDLQRRIFEPFFTTKDVGKGTGLGLDICWRIVTSRHGGDLRVESRPGETRFSVRLPLHRAGAPTVPPAAHDGVEPAAQPDELVGAEPVRAGGR